MENLFFIVMIIILITLLTFIISMSVKMSKMTSTMNEMTNMMYYILKRQKIIDTNLYEISMISNNTETELSTLSTSIDSLFKEYKQSIDKKIYPTPQLVEMITTTIKEQIAVETILTKNLRIIDKNTVNIIIENVIKTYPHVDESYIIKKTLSIVENLKTSNQEE